MCVCVQVVQGSLTAVDWDIFLPVSSEAELERLAGDYRWQEDNGITVMAGLVFKDLTGGWSLGSDGWSLRGVVGGV